MTKPAITADTRREINMVRSFIVVLGTLLCFTGPGAAQTFSHNHGGHNHSHDITTQTTSGTCCCYQHTRCDVGLAGHPDLSHAPSTTRTNTRVYMRAPTVTRTYTATAPPNASSYVVRRTYTDTRLHRSETRRHETHGHPNHDHHGDAADMHNDRGEAWAHYDRRWKLRTNNDRP